MQIYSLQHLILDVDAKDQKEAFGIIAKKAKELKVTSNVSGLIADLIKREEVSTTGMADHVAIPHAMSADFHQPAIIVVRFKKGVEWKAVGGKLVKVAFALLIPKKQRGTLHMQYLQNIATALLDKKFNQIILHSKNKKVIDRAIANAVKGQTEVEVKASSEDNKVHQNAKEKPLIIGVSACATGIAHTYMARKALEEHAKEVNSDVWVETQGQSGAEHQLTPELIERAQYVIIAADINVELERFTGKKIYITTTNEAINTPVIALKKTIEQSKIIKTGSFIKKEFEKDKNNLSLGRNFMKHFLNGVSHMIPFIVFSGIMFAITNAIIIGVHGKDWNVNDHPESYLYYMSIAANVGFEVFTAIMGGYIAVSIAGRAGLAPGFITTFIAANPSTYLTYGCRWMQSANTGISDPADSTQTIFISGIGLGVLAAILMGFASGWLVNIFNNFRTHRYIKPVMPLIVIPVVVTSFLALGFVFCLSGILGCLMNYIGAGLAIAGTSVAGRILIGLVLGLMVGFDMGGPVNKIAVATATTLIQVDPSLMGAVSAAIPIAPLGCALASTVFGRGLFDNEEKGLGVTAYFLGFMGISEGAIPFAAKRFKPTVISNIIGSGIAGLLACTFYVGGHVGMWGGLIIIFAFGVYCGGGSLNMTHNIPIPFSYDGGQGGPAWQNVLISSMWYIVAIAIGAIIHALTFVFIIRIISSGGFSKWIAKRNNSKHKYSLKEEPKVSKFENWYSQALIEDSWYYRYKVKKVKAIEDWW